ncbi:proline--tRNA ligase [bacterium]|nr:proline--tRNA ligase [bacterium]
MLTKSQKSSKTFDSVNATLLIRGGFVDQLMSGVYTFLPLGWRVLKKIEDIVREEMDKIGEEVFMPAIAPKEVWETTGRFSTVDVLFKVVPANETSKNKNGAEYVLNCTHEELITPLAKKFATSYKDLPKAVYQIQSKFRNEARAKSGIMRGREFRMKDLYSFHTSVDDLKMYYEKAKAAYFTTFKRLGLEKDTVLAAASGGDFTEDFSHEFQTRCEAGEDTIFFVQSTKEAFNKEIAPSRSVSFDQDKEQKALEKVFGENIIGVAELCEFMGISAENTTKTLIFDTEKGPIICSVRGDYEVNVLKLKKCAGVKQLVLASEETVKKVTSAEVGYAGIYNLPSDIPVFIDDSIADLVNFETGANETHYHMKNMNWGRDIQKPEKFYDIKEAKLGDMFPVTGEVYEVFKSAEVGNIFPLYTKFTDAVDYKFVDANGTLKQVYMGSYGIGTSRVMGVLVEKFHDEKGIIWPIQVAPYVVHLVSLGDTVEVKEMANKLYEELQHKNIEVLWDDRDTISAGEKFADADLIGCPIRATISTRSIEKGGVELKTRSGQDVEYVSAEIAIDTIQKMINLLRNALK